MAAKLTILTATWNRRELLPRLYASLVAQTGYYDAFEWVVVDDGSMDDTAPYLGDIAQKAPFAMHVLHQENGGKHRALNRGIQAVSTEWVLVIDSDDWLLEDGMSMALQNINSASALAGVKAIIASLDFGNNPSEFHHNWLNTLDYTTWNALAVGDTSILIRSKLMRDTPVPNFPGEKFVAESAVYARAFRSGGILL